MRQPQVQVVVGGQCVEQFDFGDGQPGVAEQRQPRRQVGGRLPQPRNGFSVPDVRWVGVDAVDQRAPQVRLPVQVVVEVAGVAVEPVDQQLRPLAGIRRE